MTGASSGIGRSIAVECSKMGASLVLTARNETRLQETLALLEGEGHKYLCADLTNEESIQALVESLPVLDGIVHNAGMADRMPCKMVKAERMHQLMAANIEGPVLLQKHLLPSLSLFFLQFLFLQHLLYLCNFHLPLHDDKTFYNQNIQGLFHKIMFHQSQTQLFYFSQV